MKKNQADFIIPDKLMKNNPWHTICFGWILQGMRDNGKSEIENANEANKVLNYLIREVRNAGR